MTDGGDDVDEQWVDLGEQSDAGPDTQSTATAAERETLSEAELLEYTTDRRSLSPTVQLQWTVRMVVGVLVLGVLVTFGVSMAGVDPLAGMALTGLFFVLGSLWVVLYYRRWVYQVREDAIYLERGVITHVRTLVPYVRIQHVDTSRGPLERALGLSTLVVYTAGSRGADVSIPGLEPAEARDLQQRVKELAIEAEGRDAL